MRALRVVGITEGGGELSVVLEDSARQERFTVPADEQLRAAARGDLTRLGQIAIELESQLRPREIQARIRAGASVDQVAAAAGVPSQKIERFAYPVLLERSRTAEVAQRAHPMRADGPDTRMLADVVAHTFGLRGQEYVSAEWDSWKGDDGRWVVALSWRAGRSDNRALWTFQPGAHGGTVTAIDEHAHDLVEGLPARPLRTVGPGDRHLPAGRAAAARARGGARAARGRVGHRGAPGRLRLVARRSRAAPPGVAAPGRAARARRAPAGPAGPTSPPPNGPLPRGSPSRDVRATRPRPSTARTAAATPHPPTAPHRRPSARERLGRGVAPATGPTSAADSSRDAAARRTAARPHPDATSGRGQARAPPRPPPTIASPGPRQRQRPAAAATADPPEAGLAARGRRAERAAPQPEAAGEPDETAAAAETMADQSPTETPAPRRAEPEATPTQQATKRGRKGKPVMPSWDEVLLGRAQPALSSCTAGFCGQGAVPSSRRTHQRHARGGRRPSRTTASSRAGRSGSALPCTACSRPLSKRDQLGRADPGTHGARGPRAGEQRVQRPVQLGAGHRDGRLPDPAERVGQVALGDGLLGDAAEQRVERGAGIGRLGARPRRARRAPAPAPP